MNVMAGISFGFDNAVAVTIDCNGTPTADVISLKSAYLVKNGSVQLVAGASAAEPKHLRKLPKDMIDCYDPQHRQEDDAANLLSALFREIKQRIEARGDHLESAIIAVPATITGSGKRCILDACQAAGLPLKTIVGEMNMAALPYCCGKTISNENVLLFHLGAHSMDAAMIQVQNIQIIPASEDSIQIHQFYHNHCFGGVNWTEVIQQTLLEIIGEETDFGVDELSDQEYAKLQYEAEQVKVLLSRQKEATALVPVDGYTVSCTITREQFEAASGHLLSDAANCVDTILNQAGVSPDAVILAGGGCHMPMIREMLENRFPGKVHCHQPELQIARGAALYSYILTKKPQSSET